MICQGLEVNHIKISMIIDDNQNINALYVFIWEFFSVDVIEIVIVNHFFFTKVTGKTVSGKGVTTRGRVGVPVPFTERNLWMGFLNPSLTFVWQEQLRDH